MNYKGKRQFKEDENGQLRVTDGGRWLKATWEECWYCGDYFPRSDYKSKSLGRFCSVRCAAKYRSKLVRSKRVTKRCVICLKQFRVVPSRADRDFTCKDPLCISRLRSINVSEQWATDRRKSHKVE